MNYSVAEFRKNIRIALDAVDRGEEVFITRHNRTFAIIKAPFNYLTTDGESHNIRPDIQKIEPVASQQDRLQPIPARIKNPDTPVRTDTEWDNAELMERGCCKLKKPCQHWEFNSNTQIWQNSLSGRQKEAEQ